MTTKMMQAIHMAEAGGPEVLKLGQIEIPEPSDTEVRIKVHCAGVNRPDVMQRLGMYPPPVGASPILGLEVSGEIDAVGKNVAGWKTGDRVVALLTGGGYAQYAIAPQEQILPWPEPLSAAQAAAIPETFFTVWSNVFDRAYADEGDTLLVHGGSSGIGSTAIMLAKAFGLTVFTTAGSDEKCLFTKELGADLAINYKTQTFEDEVAEATDGKGVDIVLDMVGGDYLSRNIRCMAVGGRHVTIAFQRGPKTNVNLAPLMLKRLTLTGSTLRARSPAFKGAVAAQLRQLVWPLFDAGELAPVIDSEFALADAASAHALMDSSAHMGKIVLFTDAAS